MYAQLGDITFEGLKGITGYRAKSAQMLAQHAVIDGKPRLQKTGDALDEVTLDMTFHRSFCNPETETAKIKSYVTSGAILPLLTGVGELVGNFTIASMDQGIFHTGTTGLIVMSTVTVNLLEAADTDILGSAIAAAKDTAFAVSKNSPLTKLAVKTIGPGLASVKAIKSADASQRSGSSSLNKANINTPIEESELRKAKDAYKSVLASMDTFRASVETIRGTISNLTAIYAAAESVKTYSQNVITAIEDGDIDSALAASTDVEQGIISLTGASSQIVTLTASRRI